MVAANPNSSCREPRLRQEILERKGFFLKVLPNSMILEFSEELIKALNEVADLLPEHLLANIGAVVKLKASQ